MILFEDTDYDVLSAALPTARWGAFGAVYARQSSGGFESRNGPNDAPTTFSIEQGALVAGWAYEPRLPGESADPSASRRLAVGLSFKSVREKIGGAAGGGTGADVGVLARVSPAWALGFSVANLVAPKPAFVGAGVPYDRVVDLSAAYDRRLSADWELGTMARLRRVQAEGDEPSGGFELRYRRLAALRFGVRPRGPSAGFGLSLGNTRVDYAALLHDLGMAHTMTLVQRFGQTREELEETIRRGISRLSRADGARLAKVYLQKAEREMSDGRTADARRDVEAATLLDPENADIAARLKKVDAQWEESLRRQTVERLGTLARRQEEQGNLPAARQYWSSVLDMDPSDVDAASAVTRLDRELSGAERAQAESLRRAESAGEIALALAAASSYLEQGQYRLARREAEKAASRHPDDARVKEFVGKARRALAEFVAARKAEAAAAAAAGDHRIAADALAAARREAPEDAELSRMEAAERAELRRALTPEARKQAEQLYYRAVEQYLKGSYDAAGALADEVLKLDPSSDAARTLKEKVGAARRFSR